ncbi:MAG TPA: NADH-quinone oxidoreductase subunit NuoE [Opitutaceae bacterium]
MLSEAERHEIEAEAAAYPLRRSACIDALIIVQRHRGWISDESLRDIAAQLEMTPHEVDSVATFYNLIYRRPVGRTVVHVCDSISCWVMGCDRLCEHLHRTLGIRFGETTTDGAVTLLPIPCLGACDHAPAALINRELHTDLTPERLDARLTNGAAAPSPPSSPART